MAWGCSVETVDSLDDDDDTSSSSSSSSSSGSSGASGSSSGSSGASSSSSGSSGACTAITLGAFDLAADDEGAYPGTYIASVTPSETEDDAAIAEFLADDTGTFDLGAAPNDNYGTCAQCLAVYVGDKTYFQSEGSVTVDSGSTPSGSKITGKFTNVKLVEVTILDADPYTSTVVEGGSCITVASAPLSVDEVLEEPDGGT